MTKKTDPHHPLEFLVKSSNHHSFNSLHLYQFLSIYFSMSCACATSSTCVISMSLCKICQLSLFVNLSYQLSHSILTVSFLSDCLISLTYDGLRLLSISVCGQLTFMSACPVTHDIRRLLYNRVQHLHIQSKAYLNRIA